MSIHVKSQDFVGITPQSSLRISDLIRHCDVLNATYTDYDQRPVFPFNLQVDGTVVLMTFDDRNWLKPFDTFMSEYEDVFYNHISSPIIWVDNATGYSTSVYEFGEDMIARDKDDHQYYSVIINP